MYEQLDITEYLYGISLTDADFLMNDQHQIQYNEICQECTRKCKQSFRCAIVQGPYYRRAHRRKRAKAV